MVTTFEEEQSRQGLDAAPESGVAELATQLGDIVADERPQQGASFPSHMFDALLRCDAIADSQHVNRLVLILDKRRGRIRETLHKDSLSLLAFVLLNSNNVIEQESGLYLLLDDSRYRPEAQAAQSNQAPISSSSHALSIFYKLVAALFRIFLDKSWALQGRRVAGKLILRFINESNESGTRIFQSKDIKNYCPKAACTVYHETDIVLRCFAGAIIHMLRTTEANEDLLWAPREARYRRIFFKYWHQYPGDWIRFFHSYIGEVEHCDARTTRARSKTEGKPGTRSCHLISSVTIGTQAYPGNVMLAIPTPDCIVFVLPDADYIEVPVQHISDPMQCARAETMGQEYALSFKLDSTDSIMVNGTRQHLSGSNVYMTSHEDLHGLCDVLRDAKRRAQKRGRRISSSFVALDTGEEVAMKSSQCRNGLSQASNIEERSSDVGPNSGSKGGIEAPGPKKYELHAVSGLSQKASELNEGSRMTTSDVEVPAGTLEMVVADLPQQGKVHEMTPPRVNEDISISNNGDEDQGDRMPSPRGATEATSEHITSPVAGTSGVASNSGAGLDPAPSNSHPEAENTSSRKLQAKRSSIPNGRAAQMKPPIRRSTRVRTLSNRKGRPALPNTQESLLFPRMGCPNKKKYTSRSKPAVDWEEDLRPTEDEEEAARAVRRDSELTSVPSPSPGDISIFSRRPNTVQKKRKSRAAPSSAKGKRSARKRRGGANRNPRTPRLPLQAKEPNLGSVDHKIINGHNAEETANGLDGSNQIDNCASSQTHHCGEKENAPGLDFSVDNGSLPSSSRRNQSPSHSLMDAPMERTEHMDVVQNHEQKDKASHGFLKPTERENSRESQRSSTHEEQVSSEKSVSMQQFQLFDERQSQQSELGQPQGSGDFQALFISQENGLGRLLSSTEDHIHAPVQALADGNVDECQKPETEEWLPVRIRRRKRAATQSTTEESPNKKSQITYAPAPDRQKLHHMEGVVEQDGVNKQDRTSPRKRNSEAAEKSSDVATVESCSSSLSSLQSKSPLTEIEKNLSFNRTPTQERQRPIALPTSSLKKSIVDENGSPRLVSRYVNDNGHLRTKEIRRLKLEDWRNSVDSGYRGDSDDGSLGSSASDSTGIHASPETVDVDNFEGRRLEFRPATIFAHDDEDAQQMDCSNMKHCLPRIDAREQSAKKADNHVESMITPYSVTGKPQDGSAREGEGADTASQALSSATTIRLPQEPMQFGIRVESSAKFNLQASLEDIQKTTHDFLLQTNERLSHQLENEKGTISQVLDSYRQGWHQVMDQLFKAHEERIELYRQQMQAVRKQHSDLCQDLIRRLEENDKRIQERLRGSV